MATYTGQTDYISQIQPTEPNLAFDAQILQAKQSKYDANHKKVSELYGSLLNSSMTRSDNIQARDEFFKIINDDVRRMGSLDFSLDQNVQAAAGVFQSIYTNNNIVKDMVWTKNYNSEINKAEAFKNCIDEAKCGGSYWEEGEKYLQYKKMEFKNASAGDALNMSDPSYIPYNNVMNKAIKIAKDAGLNITMDSFSPDGQYLITTKNGVQLKSPLTQLFGETIGKDPSIQKMFEVKAYTERKDWIYSKLNTGEFADENEAAVGFFKAKNESVQKTLQKQADDLNTDLGSISEKYDYLKNQYETGKIKQGSDEYNTLVSLPALMQNATEAKSYTDMMLKFNSNANNSKGLSALGEQIDQQTAADYFNIELQNAASVLSNKDAELKYTADDIALKQLQFKNDVALEGIKQANKMALENWKLDKGLYNDKINGTGTAPKASDMVNYENKVRDYESKNLEFEAYKLYKKNPSATDAEFAGFTKPEGADEIKKYEKAVADARTEMISLKADANKLAIKAGKWPKYTDVVSANFIQGSDVTQEFSNSYSQRIYDEFEPKLGRSIVLDYLSGDKGDDTKPVFYQLEKLSNKKNKAADANSKEK
jgi:hypothetical protein